jgi:8-oxo-dGTP diphosphatase / 2-hydroxy-dATP diphosphatase
MKKVMTLCFMCDDNQILLGMKKRGFGKGRWNGFGGKVRTEESIETAVKREVKEEVDLDVLGIEQRGLLRFQNQGDEDHIEVHIFRATDYEGSIKESEEMKPQWFKHEEIPYDQMWVDDRYWLPLFLAGKKFQGTFKFKDFAEILEYKLDEVRGF